METCCSQKGSWIALTAPSKASVNQKILYVPLPKKILQEARTRFGCESDGSDSDSEDSDTSADDLLGLPRTQTVTRGHLSETRKRRRLVVTRRRRQEDEDEEEVDDPFAGEEARFSSDDEVDSEDEDEAQEVNTTSADVGDEAEEVAVEDVRKIVFMNLANCHNF